MSFPRKISVACAGLAVALVAPVGAKAGMTLSYIPGDQPACTTKEAQLPNNASQTARANANDSWMDGVSRSPSAMLLPIGRNPNDFPTLSTFPTVFMQPTDSVRDPKPSPSLPSTFANGRKGLPVSTCSKTT